MDISQCSSLTSLHMGGVGAMLSLKLADCSSVAWLGQLGPSTAMTRLELNNNSSLQLSPTALSGLSNLQILDLAHCSALRTLPDSVSDLSSLRSLNLRDSSSLTHMPNGPLPSALQVLDLSGCGPVLRIPSDLIIWDIS